jgi:hypothetical protein
MVAVSADIEQAAAMARHRQVWRPARSRELRRTAAQANDVTSTKFATVGRYSNFKIPHPDDHFGR